MRSSLGAAWDRMYLRQLRGGNGTAAQRQNGGRRNVTCKKREPRQQPIEPRRLSPQRADLHSGFSRRTGDGDSCSEERGTGARVGHPAARQDRGCLDRSAARYVQIVMDFLAEPEPAQKRSHVVVLIGGDECT